MLTTALLAVAFGCAGRSLPGGSEQAAATPEAAPLIDLKTVAPTIETSIRYAGSDNFVGRPITGYQAPVCLLTPEAASALARVQQQLELYGLGLLVYDCYRPQQAVDHFMRWARDPDDQVAKARFYPAIAKERLVPDGYIAERSGHSRGSTVDLTLIDTAGTPLTMGTRWDFFDTASHTGYTELDPVSRRNRLLLVSVMTLAGFTNYPKEWWHFTLRDEPWPGRYFDRPVR